MKPLWNRSLYLSPAVWQWPRDNWFQNMVSRLFFYPANSNLQSFILLWRMLWDLRLTVCICDMKGLSSLFWAVIVYCEFLSQSLLHHYRVIFVYASIFSCWLSLTLSLDVQALHDALQIDLLVHTVFPTALFNNPTPLVYSFHGPVFIPTCGLLLPQSPVILV